MDRHEVWAAGVVEGSDVDADPRMSLSIAATRLPQVGQKPRFASPGKVSYQVGSPPSPVQETLAKPTRHITGVPPSFWQSLHAHV